MQQQYRLSQLQHDKVIIYSAHRVDLRLIYNNSQMVLVYRDRSFTLYASD